MTDGLLLALAALLGGVLAWLVAAARRAALAERLRTQAADNQRLSVEVAQLRSDALQLTAARAQLETRLAAEQAAQERVTNEFKAMSADALRTNRLDFLEQARLAFAELQQRSSGELEQRKQAVEALVKPLRESLDKVDHKIGEMEKARAGAYGALGEQLKALGNAQALLQGEAAKLSTALRSTSYAGSWGEFQLRRVVEMADMVAHCNFSEQESAGGLRADLVVRLPGGQRIVVDAKSPLESYRVALDATDEGARQAGMLEHARKVRSHIDALGAKNYWEQFQPAPEFVVLFLPGDHFLTAALQADSTLLDRALARRVLLATPTSLIALLKAAAYGWRQEAISRNAEEISALGRQLHDRTASFLEHFEKIGRALEAATKGYNSALGSYEGMLQPAARKLAELGAKGAKEMKEPAALETMVREVVRRE